MGIKISRAFTLYNSIKTAERNIAKYKRYGDDGKVAEVSFKKNGMINEMNEYVKLLDDKLEEVQRLVTGFCITSKDIFDSLNDIEQYFGIPKQMLNGTKISVDVNAHDLVGADTTQYDAFYDDGWIITDVYRARCRSFSDAVIVKRMARKTADAILKRFERFRL